ncbi:MAG: recombinase family protein [Clostridia bacterium]|nr:recombinase family protein [Clostridia bacterium]
MRDNIIKNIDYRVGIYIRLSREDEEKEKYKESESVQNQRTLLMQYVKENRLNYISEYVDDGISGTSFDRPGFNKMIKDIESRKNKYGYYKRFIKTRKKLCTIRFLY